MEGNYYGSHFVLFVCACDVLVGVEFQELEREEVSGCVCSMCALIVLCVSVCVFVVMFWLFRSSSEG